LFGNEQANFYRHQEQFMSDHQSDDVFLPQHIQCLKPFLAMEIMERAQVLEAQGRNIIHLEIGEPDFDTPAHIKEACRKSLLDRRPQYTHSLGLIELREAICEHYYQKYGVSITPDRVVITSGTSPGMLLICSVLLNRGDKVILTDPHYPCYPNFLCYVGAEPCFIKVREEDGFQYTNDTIHRAVTKDIKALLVNSPSNPAGTVIAPETLSVLSETGTTIISDEIYHGLVYGNEKEHTILEYTDHAFVINGFSKLYAMTGWRIGYIIAPLKFMRALQTLHQNFFISANSFVQWAALTALRESQANVAHMKRIYNERRVVLLEGLKKLGFGIAFEPTGAFYVLANAKLFSANSLQLANDILEGAGVGCTPGIDFGRNAEGYLRFTYANSMENIEEALKRMKTYLANRG
jgi:aspartate/methionine/tyrosine aminotransferase